jgi:hypothetical protein
MNPPCYAGQLDDLAVFDRGVEAPVKFLQRFEVAGETDAGFICLRA